MPVISGDTLDGVSATTLWPLHYRSAEARRADGAIRDPWSVTLYDSVSYDYSKFGTPSQSHALRAVAFDRQTRDFLTTHPKAPVVALADTILGVRTARDIEMPSGRGIFPIFGWPLFRSGPPSRYRPSITLLEFER